MAEVDLFKHIRYMTLTTTPSLIITLILLLVIGITRGEATELTDIQPILAALDSTFNINLLLFLVPALVIL